MNLRFTIADCRLAALVCALVLAGGCDPVAPDNGNRAVVNTPSTSIEGPRFKVQSQGQFDAGCDNHKREILIITDTKNGHEYLAITGVGVTELWEEKHNKSTVTVEE